MAFWHPGSFNTSPLEQHHYRQSSLPRIRIPSANSTGAAVTRSTHHHWKKQHANGVLAGHAPYSADPKTPSSAHQRPSFSRDCTIVAGRRRTQVSAISCWPRAPRLIDVFKARENWVAWVGFQRQAPHLPDPSLHSCGNSRSCVISCTRALQKLLLRCGGSFLVVARTAPGQAHRP